MTIQQYSVPLSLLAIRAAMRPDEYIVCTNATVIMDSGGRLSYFENGVPVCMIETEE